MHPLRSGRIPSPPNEECVKGVFEMGGGTKGVLYKKGVVKQGLGQNYFCTKGELWNVDSIKEELDIWEILQMKLLPKGELLFAIGLF